MDSYENLVNFTLTFGFIEKRPSSKRLKCAFVTVKVLIHLPSAREKELDEMRKNVQAQEERLGEALRKFNQLNQEQSREENAPTNMVLWETMNTAITILGDLLDSYRRYTDELEHVFEKTTRKIELIREKEAEAANPDKKSKKKK